MNASQTEAYLDSYRDAYLVTMTSHPENSASQTAYVASLAARGLTVIGEGAYLTSATRFTN